MLNRAQIEQLNDFFTDLQKRKQKGVYFYRFNGYNRQIHDFILDYHEAARLGGVIIEGKLANPDQKMLGYYGEIMGMDFRLDTGFIREKLHKWLPRMNAAQCENVANAVFDVLSDLKNAGKNENMLKNVYVKFMCWLYYRLERIVHLLGNEKLPKILYEGDVSNYELLLLHALNIAGCDIILLQYHGDDAYLKADPAAAMSDLLKIPDMQPFPPDFSLKKIRQDIQQKMQLEQLYGPKPEKSPCTNAWCSGKILEDMRTVYQKRGTDNRFFYNCFFRMTGVEDKLTYQNELFHMYHDIKAMSRSMVIVNASIAPPAPTEIDSIPRKNYQNAQQLIQDLSAVFKTIVPEQELQKMLHQAFVSILLEENSKDDNVNRLLNKAIYLLCWFKRYQRDLFSGWKYPKISVFIYMGGCQTEYEALFCRFLAKLPVDVAIFVPDLNKQCCLSDPTLFESRFSESLNVDCFPEAEQGLRVGTAAYHAEKELDTIMYQDSGMYRNQQYEQAEAVTLQTMYEEIAILWNQEMKYRPYFDTENGSVNLPVIFSKIVGVKDGDQMAYWLSIKELITPDTIVITGAPYIPEGNPNPMKQFVPQFIRNGRILKQAIRSHQAYPYGILREATQNHILDKIQMLIDRKIIKGTFENGMEFNILATLLCLDRRTIQMIQKFDFTKTNPKVIYVLTEESVLSPEDAIYFSFLNLIGFDVLFFVPTGYQCVEQHLNKINFETHQIGEYQYNMHVPNFNALKIPKRHKWRDKIFKRGT
ncbi:MAG TPA: hypothetical protein DCG49_13105 [Ruminococcus sp.]|nr:hypothetical protein [Ruminococcus sp.]